MFYSAGLSQASSSMPARSLLRAVEQHSSGLYLLHGYLWSAVFHTCTASWRHGKDIMAESVLFLCGTRDCFGAMVLLWILCFLPSLFWNLAVFNFSGSFVINCIFLYFAGLFYISFYIGNVERNRKCCWEVDGTESGNEASWTQTCISYLSTINC